MRTNWIPGAAGAALATAAVILLGAGMAQSMPRGHGCHGHERGGERFDRLEAKLAELPLDADTRAAAEQVIARARSESESRRDAMREARRTLHELLEQESPPVAQVMGQADELGVLESEARKTKLRMKLELRALLGPEQSKALRDAFRRERHHRHGGMEES